GREDNFKVTTPADLARYEFELSRRRTPPRDREVVVRKAWLHLRDVLLAPPDHRLFQRSLFAGAISVCGALASLFLALGVLALLGVAPDELESVDPGSGWRLFFGAVVIAPL